MLTDRNDKRHERPIHWLDKLDKSNLSIKINYKWSNVSCSWVGKLN